MSTERISEETKEELPTEEVGDYAGGGPSASIKGESGSTKEDTEADIAMLPSKSNEENSRGYLRHADADHISNDSNDSLHCANVVGQNEQSQALLERSDPEILASHDVNRNNQSNDHDRQEQINSIDRISNICESASNRGNHHISNTRCSTSSNVNVSNSSEVKKQKSNCSITKIACLLAAFIMGLVEQLKLKKTPENRKDLKNERSAQK